MEYSGTWGRRSKTAYSTRIEDREEIRQPKELRELVSYANMHARTLGYEEEDEDEDSVRRPEERTFIPRLVKNDPQLLQSNIQTLCAT